VRWLLVALLAACAAPPSPPPDRLPTAEVTTASGRRATATHLGGGLWLTCAHVLCEDVSGTLDRAPAEFLPRLRGVGTAVSADWVVFEASEGPPPLPSDFHRPLPTGTWVWVSGFRGAGCLRPESKLIPAVVSSRATEPGTLALRFPTDEIHPGLSGGAVLLDNVVVALLVGRADYGDEHLQIAVRPTQHAKVH
jgi:hypothetical protein